MPDSSDTARPPEPVEGRDRPTGIGVDEWVSQSGELREGYRGFTAPARRAFDNLRPGWRLAIVAVAAATVPYLVKPGGVRIAIGILILAMLALGLNVVVGWAGLLDLGSWRSSFFYGIVSGGRAKRHMALSIADYGYVLATGRIVLSDDAAALAEHEELKKAYLGR